MNQETIRKLNSEYGVAHACLLDLLKAGKIEDSFIPEILKLKNNQIISEFLSEYNAFSAENLLLIEKYINDNLDNEDRLFVSDLIEVANDYELVLPYKKCIGFLNTYEADNTYVQLAIIDYIFENLKWNYLPSIYSSLESILQNPECNQSAQLKAAFVLYRLTSNHRFLSDIIDLVVNGEGNEELLRNILKLEYNQEEFFSVAPILKPLVEK